MNDLHAALVRLTLEARHYMNTGVGKSFLIDAINEAERVSIEASDKAVQS